MRVPRNIGPKLNRLANRLVASGLNAEPVTLRWRNLRLPPGYIVDLETTAAGTLVAEQSEIVNAFVHFVNIQTSGFVRHAEVQMGDVILDFIGSIDLESKSGLRFEIGGKIYVPKSASSSLQSSWDVRCNGVPITKTVLVTLLS